MKLDTPVAAVRNRMEALHLRHAIAFPYHTPPKDSLVDAFAEEIVERLKRDDALAVTIMKALVDHADLLPDSRFWSTPLGRLLFAAGGYGEELMSQAAAARLLGCSRQWVNDLVALGQLEVLRSTSAPQVFAAHVRVLLKAKLDTLVK